MRCCAPSSASAWLDLGRRRKTSNRVTLYIERFEHGQKLRNRQEICDALRQIEQLEAAPLPADRRVRANDLAKPRAVEVGNLGQVQNDLAMPLVNDAVDLVLQQLITFTQGDLAFQVEHHHIANHSLRNLHCYSRLNRQ